MSKAFTKDDSCDAPLVVPARPPLPDGVVNYVTARGHATLRDELRRLEGEKARLESMTDEDADRPRALATAVARVEELAGRLAGAVVVDPTSQPHDEVRFGAIVTVRTEAGEERRYQIVGVDEADVANGRIAFVAPVARALLGKRVGDATILRTPRGEDELEVLAITYDGQ